MPPNATGPMRFTGERELAASRDAVWALLTDAEGLAACGRAIRSIERLAPDHVRVTAKLGSGLFAVTAPVHVRVVDVVPGERAALEARGSAAGTDLAASGSIALTGPLDGPTTIAYEATLELSGGFAGMATGFLERDGPRVFDELFDCVRARLPAGA